MEYVEGQTLREEARLRVSGRLPIRQVVVDGIE